ncbi:MAG: hypothetical protein JST70_16780 [Bacteroidetes bacterium]|nr:hypothetical protein [Bacteroidota bacterium]
MKNCAIILFALLAFRSNVHAQTFDEWFRQKETQKKYLLQQIAALQVYMGYLQKGYKIAKNGLNTISGFTKGELNLHTGYFNSLKMVNPSIKRYIRVADIITLQVKIVQDYHSNYKQLCGANALSGDELAYIDEVFARLLDDCAQTLDALITVTTDGKKEMKDDERLKRIDQLYADMQDKYSFSQSFSNDAKMVAASRLREQADIQTGRAWLGIQK